MSNEEKKNPGAASGDDTSALFVSARKKQLAEQEVQRKAAALVEELFHKNAFIAQDAATGRYCFHNLCAGGVYPAKPGAQKLTMGAGRTLHLKEQACPRL